MLRERARTAGELAEAFDMTKPSLSGHFTVLKDADLVSVERKSTMMVYRINLSVAEDAMSALMDLFRIGDEAPAERLDAMSSKPPKT